MAKQRASESVVQTLHRQEQDRVRKAKKRASLFPIEKCIVKVKQGPEFVCTCCHCMMYKQIVVPTVPVEPSTPKLAMNCCSRSLVLNITMLAQMERDEKGQHATARLIP